MCVLDTHQMNSLMLPTDYSASRRTFFRLARKLGVEPRSFVQHVHEGIALATDVAYFGAPDATALVVIASGTHGIEGYAGAACQFHFMQQHAAQLATRDCAWLLVHAVNPWGFHHDRRVTREGVDLNRNFVEFPLRQQGDDGYGRYHARLVGRGLWNEVRLLSAALTRRQRTELQAMITSGQRTHPDGLFYGGIAPTQSRSTWEEIVALYAAYRERCFLLDIHTGLGARGHGELISYLPASMPAFEQMAHWFNGELKSMASGESVSAVVEGTLTEGFDRSTRGESFAIGLEFGTCAPLTVLNALRADQWHHNHRDVLGRAERERVRRQMRHAFAPADARWIEQVLTRFDEVVERIAAGFGQDHVHGP